MLKYSKDAAVVREGFDVCVVVAGLLKVSSVVMIV